MSRFKTLSKTLIAIASAAAALSIMPAMAASATSSETKSQEISIKGYDLSDPADAKAIFEQIQRASDRVCRVTGRHETLRERFLQRTCVAKATVDAVTALNAPVVTELMQEELDG